MVRFDKPCRLVKGAVEYFREHMALGDYLSEEGRAQMTWVGEGAKLLGMEGDRGRNRRRQELETRTTVALAVPLAPNEAGRMIMAV